MLEVSYVTEARQNYMVWFLFHKVLEKAGGGSAGCLGPEVLVGVDYRGTRGDVGGALEVQKPDEVMTA